MGRFFRHPLFLLGLGLRIALVITVYPDPVREWFAPFLETSIDFFSLDPWDAWREHGGSLAAFPYGYVQWLLFLPVTALFKLCGISIYYAYFTTLLAADAGLLCVLRFMVYSRVKLLLVTYWLSPIVILGTYFFGLNDIPPIFLLFLALLCIRAKHFFLSGFFCICAVSAKLSMLLGLPFCMIYLWNNKTVRGYGRRFIQGVGVGAALFLVPFLFSTAGRQMLVYNSELHKLIHLGLDVAPGVTVYIVPLTYLLVLYTAWRVKPLNYDLFETIQGAALFGVILLMPASLGWFIWVTPFLVVYQSKTDRMAVWLVSVFSLIYLAIVSMPIIGPAFSWSSRLLALFHSSLYTTMTVLGIIICLRMWREAVSRNDFLRLSQKPFVIGIAGDSGSGKDTLSDRLESLFGRRSVTRLSGDDYHHWDRKKPMWKVMTHLNPMANDLESLSSDLIDLIDGKSVYARRYDHETGRMSKPLPVPSNDIIIVSGLHTLYLPTLRECCDLSIYLDIDESLRRYFKIQRDMGQRGHSLEKILEDLEKRSIDAKHFIHPQAAYADLVLSLQPVDPEMLRTIPTASDVRLKLAVRSRRILYEQTLHRELVGFCGFQLDVTSQRGAEEIVLMIEGDCPADDIAQAARIVCPDMMDFMDANPLWQGGIEGAMQLVVLAHINQSFNKRLL